MPYQLSQLADDDIADIIEARAAAVGARSARALYDDFLRIFELVGANPGIGRTDSQLPAGSRVKLVERRWAVIYPEVPKGQMVTISRVAFANAALADFFRD